MVKVYEVNKPTFQRSHSVQPVAKKSYVDIAIPIPSLKLTRPAQAVITPDLAPDIRSKKGVMHLEIPMLYPRWTRQIKKQEEKNIELNVYKKTNHENHVLDKIIHSFSIPTIVVTPDQSTQTSLLTTNRQKIKANDEHIQLTRTLSSSSSPSRQDRLHSREIGLPTVPLTVDQQEKILSWFWRWARERNCRLAKIDEQSLLQIREQIHSIHASKGYHLFGNTIPIWDALATHKYRRAAQAFYEAAGVPEQKQNIAEFHCLAAGEIYAISQFFLLPIRMMGSLFSLPGLDTDVAKGSLSAVRGGLHAHMGGFLSPMFDVLADFTKQGKPVPSDTYWKTPSHYDAVQRLKHSFEEVRELLSYCRTHDLAVPDMAIQYLQRALELYKLANAKTYCYAASSAVSGVIELLKGAIDISVGIATAGIAYPIVQVVTRACTALIYCLSAPGEEWAAMDQIRLQNAKYADILDVNGEAVDKEKVLALWQDPRQVDAKYIEQTVARKTAKYLYKLYCAKRRINFLQKTLEQPTQLATEIYKQKTVYEEKISFLRKQIAIFKPDIDKHQCNDIDFLLELRKNSRTDRDRQILKAMVEKYASQIDAEYKKYLSEQGTKISVSQRLYALNELKRLINHTAANPAQEAQEKIDTTVHTREAVFSALKMLCNGKRLHQALEHKLQCTIEKQALFERLNKSISLGEPLPFDEAQKIVRTISLKKQNCQRYEDKLQTLMDDYYVFKVACNDSLHLPIRADKKPVIGNHHPDFFPESQEKDRLIKTLQYMQGDGLIARLLFSRAKLIYESIKTIYKKPGIILTRALERLPVDVALLSVYEVDALGKGLEPFAMTMGYSAWIAAAIQEIARTQVNRGPYVTRYVRSLHRPEIFLERGNSRESITSIIENEAERRRYPYTPDEDDVMEFIQRYANTRSHPECENLRTEAIQNAFLSALRLSTTYVERSLKRFPLLIDPIQGLIAKKQAQKLLDEIEEHNLWRISEPSSTAN